MVVCMPGIVGELLSEKRREIIRQIIELAKDQKRMVELIDALAEVDMHLSVRPVPIKGKYSACSQAIDAVVEYLKERKTAATKDDIVKAIVEGGFRGGGREQETGVRRSIGVFLNGTGAQTKILRESAGMVGLFEWEDARFSR